MPTLTLQVPQMYGDHHVVAVRNLLSAMPGVEDVYASSAFRVVEITFDQTQVGEDALRAALQEAGYLQEMPMVDESAAGSNGEGQAKPLFRHSASSAQTGQVVSFRQTVPYAGQPLWPCPGMSRPTPVEETD